MHKTRVQLAEERGIKQGREEGVEVGSVLTLRESIQKMYRRRYGAVPLDIVDHLNSLNDRTSLASAFEGAEKSESIEQFREAIGLSTV